VISIARIVAASALLGLATAPALAEHIYKYKMPDGTILYTDSMSGFTDQYNKGKLEETLVEPTPSPEDTNAAMAARSAARAKYDQEAMQASAKGVDAAYAMIVDAQNALQQAEQNLQAGLEPLPGERLGLVNGHTRLSPAYWARVRGLRLAVEEAHDRLDRATAAWMKAR
jgi:hypothetical protein